MSSSAALLAGVEAATGVEEFGILYRAGQGGMLMAQVLGDLLVREGKRIYLGVYLRGERVNSPMLISLRSSRAGSVSTCAITRPTRLLVFDDQLYNAAEDQPRQALVGLRSGVLMLCTDKPPELVDYPYSFEGTVATVDARRICRETLNRTPPPYGVTALGLYAAATGAVDIDTVQEAIRRRIPGRNGELNAKAAAFAFESTKVLDGVSLRGTRERPPLIPVQMPFKDVPECSEIRIVPLPGISDGNVYLSREFLPVWSREKCKCAMLCILVDYCPESVISYRHSDSETAYAVDYEYCKGCGICAKECLHGAVAMHGAREVYGK